MSSPSLDKAMQCYDELDYDCADEELARAISEDLNRADQLKTRLYQALLGAAWRDAQQAKRAVRAIYQLDPEYRPPDVPDWLRRIFDSERPAPPPPPQYQFDADYVHVWLTAGGNDASWWQPGQGVVGRFGITIEELWKFGLSVQAVQHLPQPNRTGVEALSHYAFDALAGVSFRWSRLSLGVGVLSGAGFVDTAADAYYTRNDVASALDPFWVGDLGSWVDLQFDAWSGVRIGCQFSPRLYVRVHKERLHLSYLLPFTIGVRYGM